MNRRRSNERFERHEITLQFHRETEKAILVSETGKVDDAVWLPKSQISYEEDSQGFKCVVEGPAWLFAEKEFSGF